METKQAETVAEIITRLGLSLESTTAVGLWDGDWQALKYSVQLKRGAKLVWSGDYRLGIGHAKMPPKFDPWGCRVPSEHSSFFNMMKTRPGVVFTEKLAHAEAMAWLANHTKVKPQLADVLHSLLMDSSAVDCSFEDWCGEFGYNSDSIKDRDTYEACVKVGHALKKAFSIQEIAELREAFSEY